MVATPTLEECRARDDADPLASSRGAFVLPADTIYLVGHSLGCMPRRAIAAMDEALSAWASDVVGGWNRHGWLEAPRRIGAAVAPLIGAAEDEVLVADSISVNLFKLVGAALAQTSRTRVLIERTNFPADNYILRGLVSALGGGLEVVEAPAEALCDHLDASVAIVVASHVNYRSAAAVDLAELCARARAVGALTLLDLAHSAGAITVDLNGVGADLAVGCGYKYLNGGPGAPGFLFVRRALHEALVSPLRGWLGHADPFAMEGTYAPAEGVRRFMAGTPPILSMTALEASLSVFEGIDITQLSARSQALSGVFMRHLQAAAPAGACAIEGPGVEMSRGAHVAVRHEGARAVAQWLRAHGVQCDVRAPDVLRFGFSPLYVRFEDAWRAAERLAGCLQGGAWRHVALETDGPVT